MGHTVISYDISDDANRTKIANMLADHGYRVQYSVFELRIDEVALEELIERLKKFPEMGDSIRIYHICEACLKKAIILGRGEIIEESSYHIV